MKTTIDNFAQVLEFNGWTRRSYQKMKMCFAQNNYQIYWEDGVSNRIYFEKDEVTILIGQYRWDFPYFLQCLELKIGKLNELPDFDFYEENKKFQNIIHLNPGILSFCFSSQIDYKANQGNAEIVLEIKKLMDTLERT